MPIAQVTERKPLIPPGEYTLTLIACEEIMVRDFENPDGPKLPKWKWVFEADADDPAGEPYEYVLITGLKYGSDKATLTKLYDQIVPGITSKEAARLDTDDLLNKKYRTTLKHTTTIKGDLKATIVKISVVKPKGKAKPADDEEDAFA